MKIVKGQVTNDGLAHGKFIMLHLVITDFCNICRVLQEIWCSFIKTTEVFCINGFLRFKTRKATKFCNKAKMHKLDDFDIYKIQTFVRNSITSNWHDNYGQ